MTRHDSSAGGILLGNNNKSNEFIILFDESIFIFLGKKVFLNPLSADPEKWSNKLKQIAGNFPTICLSVFDHFMNLALKRLTVFHVLIFCSLPKPFSLYSDKATS